MKGFETQPLDEIHPEDNPSTSSPAGSSSASSSFGGCCAPAHTSTSKQKVKLTADELAHYAQATNFSEADVLRLHRKFQDLSEGEPELTQEEVVELKEMRANPFASRICELFSEDGSGHLSFEKFLNMLDAFSDDTPAEVKMVWAFAIWDFDGDGIIGHGDIKHGIDLITHSGPVAQPSLHMLQRVGSAIALDAEELDQIVMHICQEVDPESNGLSYFDFRGILARMPDFLHNFRISM